MQKPVCHLDFDEWIADQIKVLAPYAKTVRAVDKYFAGPVYDDVNVEFSRKVDGYSNCHFTTESLANFYGAECAAFDTDFGIQLHMVSWNDVTVDEGGRTRPKRNIHFGG